MIRFIDIRNQGTGERFAFWNTITDRFIILYNHVAWTSFDEFKNEYQSMDAYNIGRFRSLCPEWVFDGQQDDIEKWYDSQNDPERG